MNRLKKGDKVVVLTGKERGAQGIVLSVLGDRVVIEGLNMLKHHVKPNPNIGEEGGIIEREAGIHVSNVALVNPMSGRADRIGFKVLEDGRKVRVFRSNGEVVDVA